MVRNRSIAWILLIPVLSGAHPALEPDRIEPLHKRCVRLADPTSEQEAQLDQVFRTHAHAVDNWRRENAEKLRAARKLQTDALRTGDRDTFQAVGKELRALMSSRQVLLNTLRNRLGDVLDETQFARVQSLLQPTHSGVEVLQMLPRIRLADMQKADVQNLLDQAARRSKKQNNPTACREIMDAAVETIRLSVLTSPQRETLQKLLDRQKEQRRRREMLRRMEYTPRQKAQSKKILAEAQKRAAKVETTQEKQSILAEAHKTIRRDVWTDLQREQFFLSLMEKQRRRLETLGLSQKQIDRAESILVDAHEQAKNARTDEQKRQILHEALRKIRRTVLRPD